MERKKKIEGPVTLLSRMRRIQADPRDWLRVIQESSLREIWGALLYLQSEYLLEEDLRFFFNDAHWISAKTVLDLGCGPGDMIATLSNYFPNKQYTGIDIDKGYITQAKARFANKQRIRFLQGNIYAHCGTPSEYIILRLVVQHLPDLGKLMRKLRALLAANGVVLVIESLDARRFLSPAIPSIEEMWRQLRILQKKKGGNREAARELEHAAQRYSFRVLRSERATSPAVRPEDKMTLVRLYALASQVMVQKYGVRTDQIELLRQLFSWRGQPYSYGQIGVHHLLLQRAASRSVANR